MTPSFFAPLADDDDDPGGQPRENDGLIRTDMSPPCRHGTGLMRKNRAAGTAPTRQAVSNREAPKHLPPPDQAADTGILPIRACHSFGPVSCTETPSASTATVTGMSAISNS